jgi:HNH endonuclease
MESPFEDLPRIKNRRLAFEPYPGETRILGLVFQNVDTTYKFFWFLSLLDAAKQKAEHSELKIEIKELARGMVAQAWPCRRLFKLWFGHQDRLQQLIDTLAQKSGLPNNARFDEVRYAALSLSDSELILLQDFVPYRFLTPWLRTALVGVNDHARNPLIQFLADRSARSPFPTPYRFDYAIGRSKEIVIDPKWVTFLQSNYLPLRAFAQLSVARYFEARNPGVPGIINKLERPGLRKLKHARAFWDLVLSQQPLRCIYSGQSIEAGYDLDHFLPWSFVTHDLIWNLTPAPAAINLAKSDAIPDFSRYLPGFVEQHYLALPILRNALTTSRGAQLKAVEAISAEYTTLFKVPTDQLFRFPRDRYREMLETELHAQADVARRLNFQTNWIWE